MMTKEIITLFFALVLLPFQGWTQEMDSKNQRVAYLAKALSVSQSKATEIDGAFNFQSELIGKTLRDTSMGVFERREVLKRLHLERREKIDALLSPKQLALLSSRFDQERKEQQQQREKQWERQRNKSMQEKRAAVREARSRSGNND